MDYNSVEMGNRIWQQRLLLGYSREKLAELSDISPRYCYDIELGKKNMSVITLCHIADALGVSTDFILFGKKNTDDEYISSIALIKSCPPKFLPHLEGILSHYLQAISGEDTSHFPIQNSENTFSTKSSSTASPTISPSDA